EWKKVSSDPDAEKFIALYWAKREGGPASRQEVLRRIAAADQQFKMPRYKRGADSVQGRLLVTLGLPTKVIQQRGGPTDAQQAQPRRFRPPPSLRPPAPRLPRRLPVAGRPHRLQALPARLPPLRSELRRRPFRCRPPSSPRWRQKRAKAARTRGSGPARSGRP